MFEHTTLVEFERKHGQDRVDVIPHPEGLIAVLADGAGGTSGGAEAAETVIMWTRACATRPSNIRDPKTWTELLSHVDTQINSANGQTTAVVVAIFEGGIVGASVGDSAAWLVHHTQIDDLTARQVHKPLLGTGLAVPVPFDHSFASGTLLLASDGLVKYAPRARIAEMLRAESLSHAAQSLVSLVRLKAGALQDDVGIILCRPKAQRPKQRSATTRYILNDAGEFVPEVFPDCAP